MDNDALLRRISAATEAKKSAPAAPPVPAQAHPAQSATPQQPVSPRPSILRKPITPDSGPDSGVAAPQQTYQQQPPQATPAPQAAPPGHHDVHHHQPPVNAPPMQTPEVPVEPQPVEYTADQIMPEAESAPARHAEKLMSFLPEPPAPVDPDDGPRPMRREERPEAFVIACNGNMAIVQGDTSCIDTVTGLTWAVGRMLSIVVGSNRIVGMVCDIDMPTGNYDIDTKSLLHFKLELQGEVQDDGEGNVKFAKGIKSYPGVGSVVHQIRAADLAAIYAATGSRNAVIGNLSQDDSIPAYVDIPDMLSKHFAVLGSTGCGKSASVSLLLHAAQEIIPDLRTIMLDPHNEYTRAFPEGNTIDQADLDMPFWLFQLEEYVEVLFRGKPIVHEEVDALREFIPEAKIRFRDGEDRVKLRSDSGSSSMTADTAAPYRVQDVIALIDEEMGLLDSRYDKTVLKALKARINAHCNDPRYAFMFRHRTIEDIAPQVIGNFFCLPGNGALTTIIQMAGMPSEVVNAVASVLCRLAFELAIAAKGNLKILVVCEEAHRYVPVGKGGFEPTRRAIARIAKEGRKYGSFMAIISQRPSELDPTILSQCSTVFSLRLTNDFDQEIIRKAISSSSASTIAFISSLANRECIAFGEGMSTPMRMLFRNLPQQWLPGAEANVFGNSNPVTTSQQSLEVFNRWRSGGH